MPPLSAERDADATPSFGEASMKSADGYSAMSTHSKLK
jgi:hypothetical protein